MTIHSVGDDDHADHTRPGHPLKVLAFLAALFGAAGLGWALIIAVVWGVWIAVPW